MLRAKRPVLRALLMSALGLLCPTPATAHQQYAPSLVNRYGKLALADQHGLRLVHTLMVGGTPAGALRRLSTSPACASRTSACRTVVSP